MTRLFVGRDADIDVIDGLYNRVEEGGHVVRIVGEPGIGKSAFLSVATERARLRDMQVLSVSGVSAEMQMPFAGLHQLLRPLLDRADFLPSTQRSALLAAFGMVEGPSAPDLFLVALATLTLLTDRAARKSIAVMIDDAHWLDQPTFDVLDFVSRRIAADPIVVIAAFRDGSPRVLGNGKALLIPLGGVDNDAARRILATSAPDLSPSLSQRVIREAAGNPLALIELPRVDGSRLGGEHTSLRLSDRLEGAYFGRVSELPYAARTLLLVAAENDSASLHEVLRAGAELLGENPDLSILAPAVSANLVEIGGTDINFRHPLVRSAIRQSLDLSTSQSIHRALATVTVDHPDRHVWHRAASTIEPSEDLAGQLDQVAQRALGRGGAATAMATLEIAARLSRSAGTRALRLLQAAELAVELGHTEVMERLLRDAEGNTPDVTAQTRMAWIRELSQPGMVSDPARVDALVTSAARASELGETELAANLLWRASQRCWWGGASGATRNDIKTAADGIGSLKTRPQLTAILAYAAPLAHGETVFAQLNEYARKGDLDPVVTRMLGSAANVIGAFDIGRAFLARSSVSLREHGRLGDLARVLFAQAWAQVEVGDWNGALKAADEAARLAEETGGLHWVAAASIVKARVAGLRGDTAEFEASSALAERTSLPLAASFLLAMLQLARGAAAVSQGRHAEAFDHLQRIFEPADPAYNTSIQFYATADLVDAAIGIDRPDVARKFLDDIETLTAGRPVPWVLAGLVYGRALLATPDRADALFAGASQPDLKPWPFLRGRLLLAYGSWLRRQRRPADSRSPLRIARDTFDALGAAPWSDRARQELRASGEASHRPPDNIGSILSPQELHIAQMAATGLTNKEIAGRLYLSHRTVGYHLHSIFPKLGITTRAELRDAVGSAEGSPAG